VNNEQLTQIVRDTYLRMKPGVEAELRGRMQPLLGERVDGNSAIVESPAGSLQLVTWGFGTPSPAALERFRVLTHERVDMRVNALLGSLRS
jgi:hypothetical protein